MQWGRRDLTSGPALQRACSLSLALSIGAGGPPGYSEAQTRNQVGTRDSCSGHFWQARHAAHPPGQCRWGAQVRPVGTQHWPVALWEVYIVVSWCHHILGWFVVLQQISNTEGGSGTCDIGFRVGDGWEGGKGTTGGWRKGDPCHLGINDKLLPVVTWERDGVPHTPGHVAEQTAGQGAEGTRWPRRRCSVRKSRPRRRSVRKCNCPSSPVSLPGKIIQ